MKKKKSGLLICFNNIYLQQLMVQKYTDVVNRNKTTVESITVPLQCTDTVYEFMLKSRK